MKKILLFLCSSCIIINTAFAEDKVELEKEPLQLSLRVIMDETGKRLPEETWDELWPDTYFRIMQAETIREISPWGYETEIENLSDRLKDDVLDGSKANFQGIIKDSEWFENLTENAENSGLRLRARFRRDEDPYGEKDLELETGFRIFESARHQDDEQKFVEAGLSWRKIDNPALYIRNGRIQNGDWRNQIRFEPLREHVELENIWGRFGTRLRYKYDDEEIDFTIIKASGIVPKNTGLRFGSTYNLEEDRWRVGFQFFGRF